MYAFGVPSDAMCRCNHPQCAEDSPVILLSDAPDDSWSDTDDGVIVVITSSPSPAPDWASENEVDDSTDSNVLRKPSPQYRHKGPTPLTADTNSDPTPRPAQPIATHRRKRARRAVPYEFTAPRDAGEARYANISVIGAGVVVRPSSILESGNGLFADRDFKKGELITEYYGEILDRDEVELRCQLGQFQYIGTLRPQQYYIDGIREPQIGLGGASFINHSATVNSVWHEVEDRKICFTRKFARATRDIKCGEEIFVNYGKTYWSRMRRWHDTIEKEGLENISDFEGDVECDCDYTDYIKEPNKPPV